MWYLISLKHRSFLSFLSVVDFLPEDRTVCQYISYHIFVVLLVGFRSCFIIWRENYNLFPPSRYKFSLCSSVVAMAPWIVINMQAVLVSMFLFLYSSFACVCTNRIWGSVCNLLIEFTQNNLNKTLKFANNVMVVMIEKKHQYLLQTK